MTKTCAFGGIFFMGTLTALGLENSYFSTISTADGLLNQCGTNRIEIARPMTNAEGQVCQVYRFGETNLTVTMRNGMIDGMWRDGLPVNLGLPRRELEGDLEWVRLSEFYWAEMIRAVGFPCFLSENGGQADVVTVVGKRHENVDVVERLSSTRVRAFNWLSSGYLFHMNDREFGGGLGIGRQNKIRGGIWLWASVTPTEEGGLSFSNSDFSADFHTNGGLKGLKVRNPRLGDIYRYREWDEKGNLVRDRDLKKDPLPRVNINGLRIRR